MKRTLSLFMIVGLLAVTGCSGLSQREQQALSGGAIGAAGGAVAGAIVGGSALTGALIGGAAGTAIGALKDELD